MLKRVISSVSMAGVVALAVFAPTAAHSANLSGFAGFWTGGTCLTRSGGGIENTCSVQPNPVPRVYIPIPLTSYKAYNLKARIKGNGSQATTCWGTRYDGAGNGINSLSGTRSAATYDVVTLDASFNIPSPSTFTMVCELAAASGANEGGVLSVDWN
jgi:hypothetical protein